ncbi:hypothetical protein DI487_12795 [Flavobacterium sediminis]|uniref:Lipocalin-like domain-containing protein n=1 Tax=Flavobacterium sediminis TaxID=2201181 RepID=A0A2U8QXV6_9FLAO|nr:hypothetical protein [Flavobacterium sediminis]AWM14645.1 hypothetical protein DI487_12795 [Flavobacterium sediminis]
MKKLLVLLFIYTLLISCSSDDTSTPATPQNDYIEWYINGVKYTNGNLSQKVIANSNLQILEDSSKELFLSVVPDNPFIQNTTYNTTNSNIDITAKYPFPANSIYDGIQYSIKSLKILEFNNTYISGEFEARDAEIIDSETGNSEAVSYDILNGKFKIYR